MKAVNLSLHLKLICIAALAASSCQSKRAEPVKVDKNKKDSGNSGNSGNAGGNSGSGVPSSTNNQGSQGPQTIPGPYDIVIKLPNETTPRVITWDISKGDLVHPSLQGQLTLAK